MSALVYILMPDQVRLAADTLVVDAIDRRPIRFQSKVCLLSGSGIAIGGTGHAGLVEGWFAHLRGAPPQTIDELDAMTQASLAGAVAGNGGLDGVDATLYQFGMSEFSGEYVGFRYSSRDGFLARRIPYGLGIKPELVVECDDVLDAGFIPAVMRELQRRDRLQPQLRQIGIGGRVEMIELFDGRAHLSEVMTFDDHDEDARGIDAG